MITGDWSLDASNPADSPVWGPDLLGGATPGTCIPSGPFADIARLFPFQRCVWRGFTTSPTGAKTMGGQAFDDSGTLQAAIRANTTYEQFYEAIELAHGSPHVFIGAAELDPRETRPAFTGDMRLPRTCPQDPVFYLHHAYIDSLWARRQEAPGRSADEYGGGTAGPSDGLTPFGSATVSDTFRLPCVTYVRPLMPQNNEVTFPRGPGPTAAPGSSIFNRPPITRDVAKAAVTAARAPRAAAQAAFARSTGKGEAAVAAAADLLAEAGADAVLDGTLSVPLAVPLPVPAVG